MVKQIVWCPECGNTDLYQCGYIWSGRKLKMLYKCKRCGRQTVNPVRGQNEQVANDSLIEKTA